ncbi:MAG: hypothetical protein GF333_03900 [Candidatus Omnitrophica bacterium]|nr:hypothetical protein [Candidatus Omnitrophota bacterium]
MIQKLTILGFLKNQPASGYDIKKFIQKELGIFSSLETQSIYYPLKKMEEAGFLRKEERKGEKHLKKYKYYLTAAGEKEFYRLSSQALLSKKRPFMEVDIPLYFLPHLDARSLIARLRVRRQFLKKAKSWLRDKLKIQDEFLPHQRLILTHHLELLQVEENYIQEIIDHVRGRDGKS